MPATLTTALDMRTAAAHTCAAVKTCTERATTTASVGHHVVVWACTRHGETET